MDIHSVDPSATTLETGPHLVRITDGGKIKSWVSFALLFLEKNENRPIVFHTLPATPKVTNSDAQDAKTPLDSTTTSKNKVTQNVPRLLSVVEILKREYIKSLEAKHSPRLAGLHQYNEIGCLELPETTEGSENESFRENRAKDIIQALSGRNHVQQKQTPYMKVTLSLSPLPELVAKGATYQPPTIRKLSNSAKMRMKKRKRALKQAEHVVQETRSESPS